MELQIGDLFEISCTAVGTPVPEIVWRLNWGHIPEKCITKSENGVGILTCPNIQIQDQGAYSCEALNIRGTVIAVPDTILVVKPGPSTCPAGYFNEEATHPGECIKCFCFGVTANCRSADLFTYQVSFLVAVKNLSLILSTIKFVHTNYFAFFYHSLIIVTTTVRFTQLLKC